MSEPKYGPESELPDEVVDRIISSVFADDPEDDVADCPVEWTSVGPDGEQEHYCCLMLGHVNRCVCKCGVRPTVANVMTGNFECWNCHHVFHMAMGDTPGAPGSSGKPAVAICTECYRPMTFSVTGETGPLPPELAAMVDAQFGSTLEQLQQAYDAKEGTE